VTSVRDLRSHVDRKHSSEQRMSLLVYKPETAKDARKDRALAETAALLVLRKKASAIWGGGEDA
jgi:hypothetical protein